MLVHVDGTTDGEVAATYTVPFFFWLLILLNKKTVKAGENNPSKKPAEEPKRPYNKIEDRISCCYLPVGGPVHMNQHQSWLMRNER